MRLLFLLLMAGALSAEQVSWARSAEALTGEFVRVKLTTGTRIGGYWTAVTPTEFSMKVEETSNKQAVAKGLQVLPRTAIGEVAAGKRRIRGRVIGTTAGFYLGGVIMAVALRGTSSPAVLAIPVALPVGGYYLGKASDHGTRRIEFVD